jgi:two-component system LytT family response regulator
MSRLVSAQSAMLRAVIVDDEPLARERIRTLLEARAGMDIVAECADGEQAVAAVLATTPDILFLDIQMPELDGFGVLEALGSDAPPAVIFVTAFDEYAIRAFEAEAIDYLLKPVIPERFEKALARARQRLEARRPEQSDDAMRALLTRLQAERGYATRFIARDGAKVTFIRVDDVDRIEAAGNYARIHAGGKSHLVRDTLKAIEARLDPAQFVRVHRSAIVRLERIAGLEPYFHGEYVVTLRDGTRLTSSRSYSARLRALLR